MTERSRDIQILEKVKNYCDDIMYTHQEYKYDYDVFRRNPTYRNAIALCLLQIGELVKKLSADFVDSHTDIPWKAIRGMRNVVAHEYGHIDLEIVWETSEAGIKELRDFCEKQASLEEIQNIFPEITMQ